MADAVTSQTLLDGERLAIMKFTNISDGTGETAVLKVDVSTLASSASGNVCNGVKINSLWMMTNGMGVDILWDATADVVAVLVPQNETMELSFCGFGGLTNNSGAGKTGDVMFSTRDATAGDTYTIIMEMIKTYA